MADRVRAGSGVRAGIYVCTNCSDELRVEASDLPPCRDCGNREWLTPSGGDRTQDAAASLHPSIKMSGLVAVMPRLGRLDRALRSLEPKVVAVVVLGAVAVIGALGAFQAAEGPLEAEGGPAPRGFLGLFYLDGEHNLPSIFSAALWLFASLSLYAAGRARDHGLRRHIWTGLAVALSYLALDEALCFHEKLEHRTGVDWQLLYLPLLIVITAAGLYVLIQSHGAARWLLLAAGAAAFLAQMLEDVQWDGDDPVDAYRQLMVPEEILEPTAAALIAVTGLMLLRPVTRRISQRSRQPRDVRRRHVRDARSERTPHSGSTPVRRSRSTSARRSHNPPFGEQ